MGQKLLQLNGIPHKEQYTYMYHNKTAKKSDNKEKG